MATERVLHRVQVRRAAALAVVPGVITTVDWTAEDFDTDAYHDLVTNPSRLTIPAFLTGWYYVAVSAYFTNTVEIAASYTLILRKNGATEKQGQWDAPQNAANTGTHLEVEKMLYLATSDYVDVAVFHTAPGNKNLSNVASGTWFQLFRLGAG